MISREVILPLPPSTNNLFVNVGRRRAKSRAYTAWREEVGWMLNIAPKWKVKGRICLMLYLPSDMRGDISNRVKAVEDALVDYGRIDDDRNVVELHVHKTWTEPKECRVVVESRVA